MSKDNSRVSFRERWEALKLCVRWTWQSSRELSFLIFFVTILGGLLTILTPYLFKLIIDYLVEGQNIEIGMGIALGIVGILVAYAISNILSSILWDIQELIKKVHSQRIEKKVATEMMDSISSLDSVYFENPEYYNTISKANQNTWKINEFFWQFTFFISQFVSVLVIVGALLLFDYRVFLLIVLSTIPSIFLIFKTARVEWSAFDTGSPIARHANYYKWVMTDRHDAVKEIRLFGLKNHFMKKFDDLFSNYLKKQEKAAFSQVGLLIIVSIIEGALAVTAAWLVVQGFLEGRITLGEFTFLWALLFQFAEHARYMVRAFGDMNSSAVFTTPFVKLLNFKPAVVESKNPAVMPSKLKEGIEFRNVSFKYPGSEKYVLRNINLKINPGEKLALVGENGSGKTTIIKLLARLYDPTEGEILIDGVNIKEYSLEDLYAKMGVIFQDFMMYEALVEENIGFGKLKELKKKEKIHDSSLKAEAWEFIKDLQGKYKAHLGKTIVDDGTELSKGQWQKIALARAFFKDSEILILDEPTAAVDAKAEYRLFKKFNDLTKGRTSILISHRFSTVRMADNIVVIDKGKIIERGSHQELLRKNGVYAKLFRLQAEGYK